MNWRQYYKQTKNRKPSTLLLRALDFVDSGYALDLGSGGLRDAKYLKQQGFEVLAVDQEPCPEPFDQFQQVSFEDFKFPKNHYALINAEYSLFFLTPYKLQLIIKRIVQALEPGGVFAANFLGQRDEWRHGVTRLTQKESKQLLEGLKITSFQERYFVGKQANGQSKVWHLYEIVAQK